MRFKIAIALAVLGLLLLGAGIGQRTIWLPPAQLTASVPAGVAPAPLTVISPDLLKTRDGQFSMTVKSSGPIQLAVARERDIAGWIGDAAHTTIGAANEEFTALSSKSTEGAAEVPNPAGSDMWVAEEKATGELSYTWQAPGHGDWALLLSSDGKAAAPTDISVTVDNDEGTPWAVPLMIVGSALLALAALLFVLLPRKSKAAEVVPGRRAAGRVPADPATGALEVAKIVAARESAKAAAAAPAPATIAEARKADAPSADLKSDDGSAPAPAAAAVSDATSALPRTLHDPQDALAGDAAASKADAGKADAAGVADAGKPDDGKKPQDAKKDSDAPDDDSKPGSGGSDASGSDTSGNDGTPFKRKPRQRNSGGPKRVAPAEGLGTPESPAAPEGKGQPKDKDGGKNMSVKARWGAALAAVLLAGSVSPAMAETTPAAETPAAETPAATAEASATETATVGFPNLLTSQVQRIATSVATIVASGDNAKNAKELEPRVAGMALTMRTANYQIRATVESEAAAEPVNATKLLANVVSTTAAWPRSAMIVTQGENNALPQLLTLVQASARENYKLIQATPLLPGQTFPKVDKEGTKEVALDSADGLAMSPEAAISALSDRLTNEHSKFAATFKDSLYVTSVLDLQRQVAADAKDAEYVFSHKGELESAVSLRTADGGAMVVVGYNFGIDATSKQDATLTVGDDAAVFTGGTETTKGFSLNYAEPVVMYIPPAGGATEVTIISANRALVGGSFK
ncbi:hypothetical protein ART_1434 [Arthrobacter sp. PAMC 25486]|uniref:hypothetical protein n=1 Tax=Arthrobacter sp. PAMC 25486 TaxID=1494608 RepID=UPI0005361101|nr:hypothetical protein [Arthrobacter sp. PAMC 25486]AIY01033.1 hypothetical protein ART_1434 [Arthrobacter sp. PAMC 25486]